MNLDELEALAKTAKQFGTNYSTGVAEPIYESVRVPPQTILSMIVLLRKMGEAYEMTKEQLKYQVVQTKEFERQLDDMKEYHQQLIAKIAVMEVKLIEREDALYKLIDAADDSDGCEYGTLATNFVRDICTVALGGSKKVMKWK